MPQRIVIQAGARALGGCDSGLQRKARRASWGLLECSGGWLGWARQPWSCFCFLVLCCWYQSSRAPTHVSVYRYTCRVTSTCCCVDIRSQHLCSQHVEPPTYISVLNLLPRCTHSMLRGKLALPAAHVSLSRVSCFLHVCLAQLHRRDTDSVSYICSSNIEIGKTCRVQTSCLVRERTKNRPTSRYGVVC